MTNLKKCINYYILQTILPATLLRDISSKPSPFAVASSGLLFPHKCLSVGGDCRQLIFPKTDYCLMLTDIIPRKIVGNPKRYGSMNKTLKIINNTNKPSKKSRPDIPAA